MRKEKIKMETFLTEKFNEISDDKRQKYVELFVKCRISENQPALIETFHFSDEIILSIFSYICKPFILFPLQ